MLGIKKMIQNKNLERLEKKLSAERKKAEYREKVKALEMKIAEQKKKAPGKSGLVFDKKGLQKFANYAAKVSGNMAAEDRKMMKKSRKDNYGWL